MKSAKLSKKIIAIALAACMLGGTAATGVGSYMGLSTTVSAAEITSTGFEYDTNDDGTVTITGYSVSDTELVIPSEIDGKKVTSIGDSAFYNCEKLTSVTIPDSVTSIGDRTFYGCTALTSVTIPDSVTSIGSEAFYYCYILESIKIPDSVTSIGKAAFAYCYSLESITIPYGVISIGYKAFYDCMGLTRVTISDSVTSIGQSAFSSTPWLKNKPDGLIYAGKVAYIYKGEMPDNTSVIIKDGTKGIAGGAFDSCKGLTSITIPDSVISMGDWAFRSCTGLTSIIIPDSVTSISDYAFYGCTGLTSITIPDSVTSIGYSAFAYCRGLTSITIPDSVTSIGDYAFGECYNLTIYGVKGSAAQTYANERNIPFVAISPLANNSTISATTITKGDSITLKAVATGGTSPYQYAFSVKHSTATSWTTIKSYSTTATKTWKPEKTGTYKVCAKVKDANGMEVKKFFTLTVKEVKPLVNNSTISSTTINKGDTVTLKAVATGGTAPYKYSFTARHSTSTSWTSLKGYSTTSTKTWTPEKTGTYQVCAKIIDTNGTEIKKFFTLTVNEAKPLTNNSTISRTTINKGGSITLTGKATGGTAPYKYSFTARHSTSASWTSLKGYNTTSTKTWTPGLTGTYQVCAKVKDATGKELKKFFTLTVN
ncbi:MAG: leucine-rich repeat protein [Acutalibacteraceae bacterium]